MAYVISNILEKACIDAGPILDKNRKVCKDALFAHVRLWICAGFSTDAPFLHALGSLGTLL
jgi:hypothetical protein